MSEAKDAVNYQDFEGACKKNDELSSLRKTQSSKSPQKKESFLKKKAMGGHTSYTGAKWCKAQHSANVIASFKLMQLSFFIIIKIIIIKILQSPNHHALDVWTVVYFIID